MKLLNEEGCWKGRGFGSGEDDGIVANAVEVEVVVTEDAESEQKMVTIV